MALGKPITVRILGDASGLDKTLAGAQSKLGTLGTGVAVAGAAVAAGAAVVGGALFKIGDDFQKAQNTIRVGTGATGDALTGLMDDLKATAGEVPQSIGDVATAVADLNTRTGLSGEPLQDMAKKFLDLSRITGTELQSNIRNMTRLFGDWNVSADDQAGTMDLVYRAAQASGITIDDLSQKLVQFGAPLRQFGFGLDESTAMLASFEKAGVNTDTVMSGLRQGFGRLVKEGKDPRKTFLDLADSIDKTGMTAENQKKALEVFGSRALSDMGEALNQGRFSFGDFLDTIKNGTDTIDQAGEDTLTFGDRFSQLKNKVEVAVEPIATEFLGKLTDGLDTLGEKAGPAIDTLKTGLSAMGDAFQNGDVTSDGFVGAMETVGVKGRQVWDGIQSVWNDAMDTSTDLGKNVQKLKDMFASAWGAIQAIVNSVVGILQDLWGRFGDDLISRAKAFIGNLQQIFGGFIDMLTGIFDLIKAILTGQWGDAWEALKKIVSGAWEAILGIINQAINIIVTIFQGARALLAQVFGFIWDHIRGIVTGAWDAIFNNTVGRMNDIIGWLYGMPGRIVALAGTFLSAGASLGSSIINGVKDGITGAVGFVSDIVSSLWRAIKNMINTQIVDRMNDILPNDIGFGPFSIDLPDNPIPRLAMGGTMARSGIAWVGERGPEPVFLPRGARVAPSHSASRGGSVIVQVATNADPVAIGREVAWKLRTSGR